MNKLPLVAFLCAGAYFAWDNYGWKRPPPDLSQTPHVVIYGRESCPLCSMLKRELEANKIPYELKSVDEASVNDELYQRARSRGMNDKYFHIPVVLVSGELLIQPMPWVVMKKFHPIAAPS